MEGLCGKICTTCRQYLYCQGCSLCEMPFCNHDCNHCFSLCPARSASFALLKHVGGCALELKKNTHIPLPDMLPVLPDRLADQNAISSSVIAVHGGNFFAQNGEKIARVFRAKGLTGALNLREDTQGVLQFYVKDRTLEGFWDKRKELYHQLREFPWRAIIAPNFSVYEDAPRLDHLYNIKRSSIVYNEMLDAGLPAVPDISWFNVIDLQRWAREINQKDLKTVAFSFQVVGTGRRAANTYVHYGAGFRFLADQLSADLQFVLAGITSPKRLGLILDGCRQHVAVINQAAYVHSRRGQLSETGKKAPDKMTKNQIFRANLTYYENEYRRINQNAEAKTKQ